MGPTGLTPEEMINLMYMKNLEEENAQFRQAFMERLKLEDNYAYLKNTADDLRNYIFELQKELDEVKKENIQLRMERDRYKGEVEELGGLLDEYTDY